MGRLPPTKSPIASLRPGEPVGVLCFSVTERLTCDNLSVNMRGMTPTQQLAEAVALQRLGYPLAEWIYDQREADKSWRTIAQLLSDATDNIVEVSWETLRSWYGTAA